MAILLIIIGLIGWGYFCFWLGVKGTMRYLDEEADDFDTERYYNEIDAKIRYAEADEEKHGK